MQHFVTQVLTFSILNLLSSTSTTRNFRLIGDEDSVVTIVCYSHNRDSIRSIPVSSWIAELIIILFKCLNLNTCM